MWQRWNSGSKIFEKSDNKGASWTPLGLDAAIITQGSFDAARIPNLDASKITTGTLDKARQHAQTAYKDEANVFTAHQTLSGVGVKFSGVDIGGTVGPALGRRVNRLASFLGSGGAVWRNNGDSRDIMVLDDAGQSFSVYGPGASQYWNLYNGYNGNYAAIGNDSLNGLALYSRTSTGSALSVHLPDGSIKFPSAQLASADANTLDDYEEGAWTPVLDASGPVSGQTYVLQYGRYIKIGREVYVEYYMQLSAKGSITGSLRIAGLPFTSANNSGSRASGVISQWRTTSSYFAMFTMHTENVSYMVPHGLTAAATEQTTLATANIADNTIFAGSYKYLAAS